MPATDEHGGALTTAAVAAAAGAAAYGLRRALSGNGGGGREDDERDEEERDEEERGRSGSRGGSLVETVWDSAADSVVPLVEEAADAAGKWLAENSPELLRERIIPRFIEAFQDAA